MTRKKSRAGFGQRFFFGSLESFFGASGSIEVHLDEISCQLGHRTQSSPDHGVSVLAWFCEMARNVGYVSHPRFFPLPFSLSLSLLCFPLVESSVSVEKLNEEEEARKRGKKGGIGLAGTFAHARASRNFKRSNGPPTRNGFSSDYDTLARARGTWFPEDSVTAVDCYDRYD